mmetsp:Transcript_15710/g.24865  ORF Transcript_15710/g.24865 Transcript_15710/m.24865 type:complete len:463 (-) Transcript_15710:88-1476(-)
MNWFKFRYHFVGSMSLPSKRHLYQNQRANFTMSCFAVSNARLLLLSGSGCGPNTDTPQHQTLGCQEEVQGDIIAKPMELEVEVLHKDQSTNYDTSLGGHSPKANHFRNPFDSEENLLDNYECPPCLTRGELKSDVLFGDTLEDQKTPSPAMRIVNPFDDSGTLHLDTDYDQHQDATQCNTHHLDFRRVSNASDMFGSGDFVSSLHSPNTESGDFKRVSNASDMFGSGDSSQDLPRMESSDFKRVSNASDMFGCREFAPSQNSPHMESSDFKRVFKPSDVFSIEFESSRLNQFKRVSNPTAFFGDFMPPTDAGTPFSTVYFSDSPISTPAKSPAKSLPLNTSAHSPHQATAQAHPVKTPGKTPFQTPVQTPDQTPGRTPKSSTSSSEDSDPAHSSSDEHVATTGDIVATRPTKRKASAKATVNANSPKSASRKGSTRPFKLSVSNRTKRQAIPRHLPMTNRQA